VNLLLLPLLLHVQIGALIVFSFCCQMGCGAVFGIVPFVSKRSTGTVTGIVAAGGSLGSAVTQVRL
jgi:NNP family nitrate/nitrite transporter-like MFS transporter